MKLYTLIIIGIALIFICSAIAGAVDSRYSLDPCGGSVCYAYDLSGNGGPMFMGTTIGDEIRWINTGVSSPVFTESHEYQIDPVNSIIRNIEVVQSKAYYQMISKYSGQEPFILDGHVVTSNDLFIIDYSPKWNYNITLERQFDYYEIKKDPTLYEYFSSLESNGFFMLSA